MKRRGFLKGILGLSSVAIAVKAGIGGGSSDKHESINGKGSENDTIKPWIDIEASIFPAAVRVGDLLTLGNDKQIYRVV